MVPYTVLATGYKIGYIEFVNPSLDLVKIHELYSFNCGMSIHEMCLVNWLSEKISKEVNEEFIVEKK